EARRRPSLVVDRRPRRSDAFVRARHPQTGQVRCHDVRRRRPPGGQFRRIPRERGSSRAARVTGRRRERKAALSQRRVGTGDARSNDRDLTLQRRTPRGHPRASGRNARVLRRRLGSSRADIMQRHGRDLMTAIERSLESRRQRTERLTQVGPGTPMGAYLRCFWHPVAAVAELEKWPVKKVRILGETLALFRGDDGTLGLVADRCPHRGASLSCAMTDGGLIRCAYHAWAFDRSGQCVDTPAEPPESKLKNRIKIASYEVQELGGLIWAYLGRSPAPLLPRFEHVVREDLVKRVGFTEIPCNWLQISENNVDPLHLEYLHMRYINWVRARRGEPPLPVRKHARIEFEIFEYGILKKRLWEGDSEDSQEWQVGHPLFFPGNHFFRFDTADMVQYQFRVPADDEQTNVYWYEAHELNSGEVPTKEIPIVDNPWRTPDGEYMLDTINGQDMM